MYKVFTLVFLLTIHAQISKNLKTDEVEAAKVLEEVNYQTLINVQKENVANWNYEANLTEFNFKQQLKVLNEVDKETKIIWNKIIQYDWRQFKNYSLKRQFKLHSILGAAALPKAKRVRLVTLTNTMKSRYSTSKMCSYVHPKECQMTLEPDVLDIFETSRNPEELKHYWISFRDKMGPHSRKEYEEYITLLNEEAKLNNFTDAVASALYKYEDDTFREEIESIWEKVKPFYLQLHGYVRHQLHKIYGKDVSLNGPIPAHLLGNMWALKWNNIADITLPYKNINKQDITKKLKEKNYTVLKIFKTAENFYKSINLSSMTPTFWEKTIMTKPKDRQIVCHASAWNFQKDDDYRIKECAEVEETYFYTTHHEMGHIEYFMQYNALPVVFRQAANPGFHEAVGDCIALSVSSVKHLKKLGLYEDETDESVNQKQHLNQLYRVALDKVMFLPYAYIMDRWRWDVYTGKIKPANYNCKWWELRNKYQGLEPPVDRSEHDFDIVSKFHVAAGISYIRYFVSFIIQFQFHRALCKIAGQYEANNLEKPLHNCDIYESVNAGNEFKKMLAMGYSKPWMDEMEILTGQRYMDPTAILEYFKPVHEFLDKYNKENKVVIGWGKSSKVCTSTAGIFTMQQSTFYGTVIISVIIIIFNYVLCM